MMVVGQEEVNNFVFTLCWMFAVMDALNLFAAAVVLVVGKGLDDPVLARNELLFALLLCRPLRPALDGRFRSICVIALLLLLLLLLEVVVVVVVVAVERAWAVICVMGRVIPVEVERGLVVVVVVEEEEGMEAALIVTVLVATGVVVSMVNFPRLGDRILNAGDFIPFVALLLVPFGLLIPAVVFGRCGDFIGLPGGDLKDFLSSLLLVLLSPLSPLETELTSKVFTIAAEAAAAACARLYLFKYALRSSHVEILGKFP